MPDTGLVGGHLCPIAGERSPDLGSALTMSIWSALTVLMQATTALCTP